MVVNMVKDLVLMLKNQMLDKILVVDLVVLQNQEEKVIKVIMNLVVDQHQLVMVMVH